MFLQRLGRPLAGLVAEGGGAVAEEDGGGGDVRLSMFSCRRISDRRRTREAILRDESFGELGVDVRR